MATLATITIHEISTNSRTLDVRMSIIDPKKSETAPPIASIPMAYDFYFEQKEDDAENDKCKSGIIDWQACALNRMQALN